MGEKNKKRETATDSEEKYLSRKDFLKKIGSLAGLAVTASSVSRTVKTFAADKGEGEDKNEEKVTERKIKWKEGDDVLLRMQDDIYRALKKPRDMRHWAMAIDTRKCIGCYSCTISCIAENKLPPGVAYRPVIEEEMGKYPNIARRYWPRPCFQCDNPPCVPVCPVRATWKRSDGVVVINYKKCIGCRYCITACPYSARYFDFGEYYSSPVQSYERVSNFEYKKSWIRKGIKSPIGNARKCHFCIHLIEKDILPRCVSTCIGRATYFGDLNDPESLISKLSGMSNIVRLKEELGTKPTVFYLI